MQVTTPAHRYHTLYCKLKMLALMKEHNPVMARAPRPVEETEEEKEMKRQLDQQQEQ